MVVEPGSQFDQLTRGSRQQLRLPYAQVRTRTGNLHSIQRAVTIIGVLVIARKFYIGQRMRVRRKDGRCYPVILRIVGQVILLRQDNLCFP